jgi:hypothetical protein
MERVKRSKSRDLSRSRSVHQFTYVKNVERNRGNYLLFSLRPECSLGRNQEKQLPAQQGQLNLRGFARRRPFISGDISRSSEHALSQARVSIFLYMRRRLGGGVLLANVRDLLPRRTIIELMSWIAKAPTECSSATSAQTRLEQAQSVIPGINGLLATVTVG